MKVSAGVETGSSDWYFFFKTAANFLTKRVPEMCVKVSKERRKVCISLACVADVTFLFYTQRGLAREVIFSSLNG